MQPEAARCMYTAHGGTTVAELLERIADDPTFGLAARGFTQLHMRYTLAFFLLLFLLFLARALAWLISQRALSCMRLTAACL